MTSCVVYHSSALTTVEASGKMIFFFFVNKQSYSTETMNADSILECFSVKSFNLLHVSLHFLEEELL